MKPGGGKVKGSGYEREISKRCSLWITDNLRDDVLWRTQSSGGRRTQRIKKNVETEGQAGDITSTCDEGKVFKQYFCAECKFYKDLELWSLITKKEGNTLYGFWKIIEKLSCDISLIPVLIAKQNRKPELWITNFEFKYINPVIIVDNIYVYLLEDILKYNFRELIDEVKVNNEKIYTICIA